jgi:uncharacterized oligopeptide transporter (OPT) family protein
MPALMILGYDMDLLRVMLVATLGGLLGILMMIPLRRAFIVQQHGTLTYPEGTACAKVLIVGEQGGASAKTVFAGFGIAFLYQALMQEARLWQEIPARAIQGYKGAVVACEVAPALLGVGYIIGPRIASVMVGGGVLAALVLTPAIAFFGQGATVLPGTQPIAAMSPRRSATSTSSTSGRGGRHGRDHQPVPGPAPDRLVDGRGPARPAVLRRGQKSFDRRTERDLPMGIVLVGSAALVATIAATHLIPTGIRAASPARR